MKALKRRFTLCSQFLLTSLALGALTESHAGTFSSDFNTELPPTAYLTGSAIWDATGGVDGSGVIKLTQTINGQMGTMILEDLDGGAEITGFTAHFKMLLGGGTATPADGLSFNFAPNLYDWPYFGEEGAGSGLTVSFDTYNNGGGEAPAIDVKKGGVIIASAKGNLSLFHTGSFVDVLIQAHPDGTVDVSVNGTPVFTGLLAAFSPSPGNFGFGGRTGALNDNHFIDDVQITTTSETAAHPFVLSASPQGTGVNEQPMLEVSLKDGLNHLVPSSVSMKLNGAAVTPSVTKDADITTVSFDPPGFLPSGTVQTVSVTYTDDGTPAATQTISYSFTVRYYLGPNGNAYELIIPEWGMVWEEANIDAQNRNYFGRPGHLATLTSREEDIFANKLRTTATPDSSWWEVWIGGFQEYGQSSPTAGWQWVNNEGPISGVNGGSTYSNWRVNEPNDGYGPDSENYLTLGFTGEFSWNDNGYFGGASLRAYIIEYEALPVALDIKPGSSANVVNVQDNGALSVALLSAADFDASLVPVDTIRFGRTGLDAKPVSSLVTDVNSDGRADLLLTFNLQDTGLRCGDTQALMFGRDQFGGPFKGSDAVTIKGCPEFGFEVTALQDVTHKTDVQLTVTPLLAGYTAPTTASQIRLKSTKISGQVGWNKTLNNYPLTSSGSSSVALFSYTDLVRGQKIDAKMNIPNSKYRNGEVLRSESKVLYRPDLAIGSIVTPAQIRTFQALNISVPVNELNGDLGANATASLYDNNILIDSIPAVAISAGGNVGLVFTVRFATAGVHNLKVVVGSMQPGDYDYSNNEALFSIEAIDPILTPMYYTSTYFRHELEQIQEWDNNYSSGNYYELVKDEYLLHTMEIPAAFSFPLPNLVLRLTADGEQKLLNVTDNVGAYVYQDGCFWQGQNSLFLGNQTYLYIDSSKDTCAGTGNSYVSFQKYAYKHVYFSHIYWKEWGFPEETSFNNGGGTFLDANTSISARVIVTAPEGSYGGEGGIPNLLRDELNIPYDYPFVDGYERGLYRELYVTGDASGETTP